MRADERRLESFRYLFFNQEFLEFMKTRKIIAGSSHFQVRTLVTTETTLVGIINQIGSQIRMESRMPAYEGNCRRPQVYL